VLPEPKMVGREVAELPKIEVVGLSEEKVAGLFGDTITQVRRSILAGIPETSFQYFRATDGMKWE
jgi:hypothetical protein